MGKINPQPQTDAHIAELLDQEQAVNIGIPKEHALQERRLCLTPEGVSRLVAEGYQVQVETCAGDPLRYADADYAAAGAVICDTKTAFGAAIVLKVEPPTLDEIAYMKPHSVLFSALQLRHRTFEYIDALNAQRMTAIAFEFFQDQHHINSIQRAMSEIAGHTAVFVAAELMGSAHGGLGWLFGGCAGILPTRVLLLGAGSVGTAAAKSAMGLGAQVEVFDNSLGRLRMLRDRVPHVPTSLLDYDALLPSLYRTDVLIGAMTPSIAAPRCVITEQMVKSMKPGALIIDLSIDQGECIETTRPTTHDDPTFTKHGVIHYCVSNITSRSARTATQALNNIIVPLLIQMGRAGGGRALIQACPWFHRGIYTFGGHLTHAGLAQHFQLRHQDLVSLTS